MQSPTHGLRELALPRASVSPLARGREDPCACGLSALSISLPSGQSVPPTSTLAPPHHVFAVAASFLGLQAGQEDEAAGVIDPSCLL